MTRWAPESSASPYVVSLRPGTDVDAFAAAISDDFGGGVLDPLPLTAVRNVDRIRSVPYVLAAFVTLLAAGAFVHALLLSVRRQRPQLAVLRSLGFTRRQVGASVWAYATVLAVTSVAVGVPLGIVGGRWGWRVVAGRLGVVTVEVTPVAALVALVIGVLAFTTVVAAVPAWRAQRVRVGPALRAE